MSLNRSDSLQQTILQSEIERIPGWLRITKAKLAGACVLEALLIVAAIFTFNYTVSAGLDGSLIIFLLIASMAIMPLWFLMAYRREARAYQTATYIAAENRRRDGGQMIRSYGGFTRPEHKPSKLSGYSEYCPGCGFILIHGEDRCRTCGTTIRKVRSA